MRTRDMTLGARVEVKFDAPGDLANVGGLRGTIVGIDGRIADVRFTDTTRPILCTYINLVDLSSDTPELAAFKERVAKVARKYARENGWCEVVDDALREMGIEPPEPGKIRLVFEVPENEFSTDEGENVMDDIAEAFYDLMSSSFRDSRAEWLKSAEYVNDNEEDK